jgi:hypothetical protein
MGTANLFRSNAVGDPIIRQMLGSDRESRLDERMHFYGFSVGFGEASQMRDAIHPRNADPASLALQQRCDNPLKHGDFSEMPYWMKRFWRPAETQ